MSRRFVIKYLIGGYGAFGKVAEEHMLEAASRAREGLLPPTK